MLIILLSIISGLFAFFLFVLSGITVIGVCKYKKQYSGYFHSLRRLGTLGTIKRMAGSYLAIMNQFLGPKVGFKQKYVLSKTKLFGNYIEHLLLFYWFSATILVLAFRPIEQPGENTSSPLQAAAFLILLSVNVTSDAISLLWTKRCIALLVTIRSKLSIGRLFFILAQDIFIAFLLMIIVQFISNGLYAVQIGSPEKFLDYMLDYRTAFKLYAPVDPRFSYIQFPGQLLITCTTYLPSLAFYFFCIVTLALVPFHKFTILILNVFKLDSSPKCNQATYIGALLGTAAGAYSSLSYSVSKIALAFTY